MTNGNGAPLENAAPPQFNVLAQYIKDFSFENPNSPASLAAQDKQPTINIQINVTATPVADAAPTTRRRPKLSELAPRPDAPPL